MRPKTAFLPLNQVKFRFFLQPESDEGTRVRVRDRKRGHAADQIRSDTGPEKGRSEQMGAPTDKIKPDGRPDRYDRRAPSVWLFPYYPAAAHGPCSTELGGWGGPRPFSPPKRPSSV